MLKLNRMKLVFALGGSIVVPDKPDTGYIKRFAKFADELSAKHRLVIVVGGGKTARQRIAKAITEGASQDEQDMVGIEATRENAKMVAEAIGEKANQKIPKGFDDAIKIFESGKITVMGGTEPGHSTDAVAIIMGERIGSDIVFKTTDVGGIYDKDPQRFSDAKRFDIMTPDQLLERVAKMAQTPGRYELVDLLGAKVLKKAKLKMIALDGRDLGNIRKAIEGKPFVGTTVE